MLPVFLLLSLAVLGLFIIFLSLSKFRKRSIGVSHSVLNAPKNSPSYPVMVLYIDITR